MKEFKYKINGAPYRVVVKNSDNGIVELEVNGTPFVVEVEEKSKKPLVGIKRPSREAAPAPTPKGATTPLVTKPSSAKGANAVQSPLPGVILELKCKEGDAVKKGDTLMILEAMKMENNILANASGTISKVLVNKGDSVLEGADLVIID